MFDFSSPPDTKHDGCSAEALSLAGRPPSAPLGGLLPEEWNCDARRDFMPSSGLPHIHGSDSKARITKSMSSPRRSKKVNGRSHNKAGVCAVASEALPPAAKQQWWRPAGLHGIELLLGSGSSRTEFKPRLHCLWAVWPVWPWAKHIAFTRSPFLSLQGSPQGGG